MFFLNIEENLSSLWEQQPQLWKKEEIIYREELGDTLDIFVLKNLQNHILLYDPSLLPTVYRCLFGIIKKKVKKWKKNLGLTDYFSDFNNLEDEEKKEVIETYFEEHINTILKKFGLGILDITKLDFKEKCIQIHVSECAEAHEATTIGHPICFNVAAILGGAIGGVFEGWQCYEKECKSTGANFCNFILAPQENINEEIREFLDLPSRVSFTLRGKITSMISKFERRIDYTPIIEETTNRLSQLLPDMKSKNRSHLGHEINFIGFQQYYLSFLIKDFEYGSKVLYKAGEKSGKRFSKILSAMGMRSKDKVNVLPRFFDRLGIGILKFRKINEGFEAKIGECGFSYNLDVDEEICFFNSGFLAGFFTQIKNTNFVGEEKKCSGESGDLCVHKIVESGKKEKNRNQ